MRKKLDTRFPAARIKKIMQADEDVGKIAMAVPLLVSKALELFLQDLCDRTYDITLKSGAKTLNSGHLKQCVQSFNVFDFLREIVSRVPDLGCHDTGGEDHPVTKRRKTAGDEENESEEDVKNNHVVQLELGHINSSGRRRGRGRGRPRKIDDTDSAMNEKYEDDPENIWKGNNFGEKKYEWQDDSKEKMIQIIKAQDSSLAAPVRNFDLNLDLDENGDTTTTTTIIGATEVEEYYPGWYHVQKMAIINPLQLASLNTTRIEDEDYDEEEEEG